MSFLCRGHEFFANDDDDDDDDDDFFFCASDIVGELETVGVATAKSGPTPSQNPMGSDARSLRTGYWDGARGFPADPTPQTACSVIGTAPRASCDA